MSLLRLAIRCPVCGTPPAFRLAPEAQALLVGVDPAQRIGTIQCQECSRQRKTVIYEVIAKNFQEAA